MFGMDAGPGSRARWLLLAVVVCVGAAGAALYFHESAVAPAPAEPVATDPAPAASADAVAAATAAGPEDVVTPAETAADAAPADDAGAARGTAAGIAADTDAASAETSGETDQASAPAAADADAAPADTTTEAESAAAGDAVTDAADADAAAPPTVAVQPEPEPEPEPPAPIPPSVTVTPPAVRQGQATLVVLAGDVDADDVWVSIDDYSGQMVFEEGVGWVGFVPVERLARPRLYHVVVDTSNNGIYARTYLSELLVEAEVAVIDEITLDAENAALLTPEMVAIDNHTRYEQYKAVSGPRLWSGPWGLPLVGVDSGAFGVLRSYNGGPADGLASRARHQRGRRRRHPRAGARPRGLRERPAGARLGRDPGPRGGRLQRLLAHVRDPGGAGPDGESGRPAGSGGDDRRHDGAAPALGSHRAGHRRGPDSVDRDDVHVVAPWSAGARYTGASCRRPAMPTPTAPSPPWA